MFKQRLLYVAVSILILFAVCIQDKVAITTTQEPVYSRQFVFAICSGIWIANQDGTEVANIVSASGSELCLADLTEDGTRVAYWAGTGDQAGLWISDIDSWNPHLVSGKWPAGFEPAGIKWGANPHLVFVVGYKPVPRFFAVNLVTGQHEDWGWLMCPLIGVSPRTGQLAGWVVDADDADHSTAEVIETDGSHWQFTEPLPSNLVDFEECATYAFPVFDAERDGWSWSPNREQIAVVDHTRISVSIAIISTSKDKPENLTTERLLMPSFASHFAWSPQGQHLAFESRCTHKNENCVFVLDLSSREIIWEAEGHSPLYWHQDGTTLLFNLSGAYFPHYDQDSPQIGLWSLDLTTLEASRILTTPVSVFAWRQR